MDHFHSLFLLYLTFFLFNFSSLKNASPRIIYLSLIRALLDSTVNYYCSEFIHNTYTKPPQLLYGLDMVQLRFR